MTAHMKLGDMEAAQKYCTQVVQILDKKEENMGRGDYADLVKFFIASRKYLEAERYLELF